MIYRFFVYTFLLACISSTVIAKNHIDNQPKIALSFDDGSTSDMPGYSLEKWNELLLKHLQKYQIQSALFSSGKNKQNIKGKFILNSWNAAGHRIGNHSFSHQNFNNPTYSLLQFEQDFLKNDSIIRLYSNYFPFFRFPFLKEGNTAEKVNGFRDFLKSKGYSNAHVSIDASDWYIDARLVKRLKQQPKANISAYKKYYIEHLFNRATYYDSLAFQLCGRHIHHVLLLHHNLAAALFLGDLIEYFKANGWEFTSIEDAYNDEFYSQKPSIIPAGESLVWALAKQSGKFESVLRYPAEDGEYEREAMDKLGL